MIMPQHELILIEALIRIRDRISTRMNNRLCEMKPDYDDAVTGFNEAWDITIATLNDAIQALRDE
jgi:hypothetical protein